MSSKKKFLRFDRNKSLEIIEEEPKSQNPEEKKAVSALSLASELGFSISLPIVGGAFLGQFLDNKFNTSPRITLSLVFLGMFLGLTNIYLIIKKNSK